MRSRLVLASASPRRRELLERMGEPFVVMTADVDEHIDMAPREAVRALAVRKARAVADQLADGVVLGADTLVALDGRALGKPEDENDARHMLKALSARAHDVFTGVCLTDAASGECASAVECTRVAFRELTDAEIDQYIMTGEPMDKAGAYAIQGGAGAFVSEIDGSFENVMGLPVQLLKQMLAAWEAK